MEIGKTYKAGAIWEEEKDTKLYAMWSATEYEVIFDANGGQVLPASKAVVYEGEYGSLPTPTKEGHTFKGWYTHASGGTKIESTTKYTTAGNQTIYAQWEQDYVLATAAITPSTYGESVNYSANGVEDWKIFLNDETNIYIIAGDYVPRSGMTLGTGISAGNGDYCVKGNSRDNLVNWLKDTSKWSKYANGISGITGTVTGGPTLAQFVKSYNNKKGTSYLDNAGQSNGFISNITDELYNTNVGSWYGYWLTSIHASYPTNVWVIGNGNKVWTDSYDITYYRNSSVSLSTIWYLCNKGNR